MGAIAVLSARPRPRGGDNGACARFRVWGCRQCKISETLAAPSQRACDALQDTSTLTIFASCFRFWLDTIASAIYGLQWRRTRKGPVPPFPERRVRIDRDSRPAERSGHRKIFGERARGGPGESHPSCFSALLKQKPPQIAEALGLDRPGGENCEFHRCQPSQPDHLERTQPIT